MLRVKLEIKSQILSVDACKTLRRFVNRLKNWPPKVCPQSNKYKDNNSLEKLVLNSFIKFIIIFLSVGIVDFVKDFPFLVIWATLGGRWELGGKHFRQGHQLYSLLCSLKNTQPPLHSRRAGGQGKPSLSAHFAFLSCQCLPSSSLYMHRPANQSTPDPPPPLVWAAGCTLQVAAGGTILCLSATTVVCQPGTTATSADPDCPVLGSGGTKNISIMKKD